MNLLTFIAADAQRRAGRSHIMSTHGADTVHFMSKRPLHFAAD